MSGSTNDSANGSRFAVERRARCLGSAGVLTVCLAIVLVSAGCGNSRAPTPPTIPSSGDPGCGLGPVPIAATGPEPCPTVAPACPVPRPANARTLVWVGTCSFGGQGGGCQPIQLPGCPADFKVVHLLLASLERGAAGACLGAGELTLDARATDNGGVHLLWEALEFDPITCTETGATQRGEVSLPGPCCDRHVDVRLPRHDLTIRIDVRSDWQR